MTWHRVAALVVWVGVLGCDETPAPIAVVDSGLEPGAAGSAKPAPPPSAAVDGGARPDAAAQIDRTPLQQCNDLISVINTEQAAHKDLKGDNPEDLKKLAAVLDGTARRIRGIDLSDQKLRRLREDYAKMAEDLAQASRDAANAGGDMAKLEAAIKVMQGISPREDKLVNALNDHCKQIDEGGDKRFQSRGFSIPVPAGFSVHDEKPFKAVFEKGGVVLLQSEPSADRGRASINIGPIDAAVKAGPTTDGECRAIAKQLTDVDKTVLSAGMVKLPIGSVCQIEAKDPKLQARRHRFAVLPGKGAIWVLTCTFDNRDEGAKTACQQVIGGWQAGP